MTTGEAVAVVLGGAILAGVVLPLGIITVQDWWTDCRRGKQPTLPPQCRAPDCGCITACLAEHPEWRQRPTRRYRRVLQWIRDERGNNPLR